MDLSLTGYILLVTTMMLVVLFPFPKITGIVFKLFTGFLLLIFSTLLFVDMELYRHWGFRIDTTPFLYLGSPSAAMASMPVLRSLMLLLLALLFVASFMWLFEKWLLRYPFQKVRWYKIPVFLLVALLMIIPVRGGVGLAPMNPGKVYFSNNIFCNHAALNVVWNFLYNASKAGEMYKKYPQYVSEENAESFFANLRESADSAFVPSILTTSRPNVVVILLESFTSKAISTLGGMEEVTPGFNKLAEEGLLFTRLYASGGRSDKGLVAVLSGFPAQSTQSVIKHTEKASRLPSLSRIFHQLSYNNTFYYGGDLDFANMRSYLVNGNYHNFITRDDFPASYRNSKWGVHDEYVFQKLLDDLDHATSPYFKFLFTLSSHEPYDIPEEPRFAPTSEENMFLSSMAYTDKWLGWFFEQAKQRDWYENTLFVLIADHGHRFPANLSRHLAENYRIPMLWLGGALQQQGRIETLGSQTDLAATLLYQLGLDNSSFMFSRNLLAPQSYPFAYYAFTDGFGFVSHDDLFIWDHQGQRSIMEPRRIETRQNGFSWFQYYHNYYLGF